MGFPARAGADDVAFANDLVVDPRGVDAPLVGVQHADVARPRPRPSYGLHLGSADLLLGLLEAVVVDARPAPPPRELATYDLLREHGEVEGQLPVPAPRPERHHVGDDHLARTVHRLPGGEHEVGIGSRALRLQSFLWYLASARIPR